MPLPGIKRRRSGSDEEPGELVDDDSSSASDSEAPRSEDRERSQSRRSSYGSYYRDKERDRSRERSWDYHDRSLESYSSWYQSGDRSRHWSDRHYHRYIHRHGSSPSSHRQQSVEGRFNERRHHSYHGESKRRRYSSGDHDQQLLSSFSGEHERCEADYSEDLLPYTTTSTSNVLRDKGRHKETIRPRLPLEPPPDFHESEISYSPPVVEPSFVSEVFDPSAVVKAGDSPSRMTKEELLHSMDLADREITEVEQQIGKLKRRLAQEETELQNELAALEEKAKEEVKQEDKSPSIAETQRSNGAEATPEENVEFNIPYNESIRQLILKIYGENRRKAAASRALLSGKGYPMANPRVPLYNQPSDLPFYKENQERAKAFYPVLVNHLHMKHKKRIAFENWQVAKYQQLKMQWEKTLEEWENNPRRKLRETKIREFYERIFPEIRKQREREERVQRAQKSWSFARSEAELNEIADILHEQELVQCQIRDLSVMPPPLLSEDERKVKFINRNGLIEDPMADHKNRRMLSVWSDSEKKIFREEFVRHPKDFDKIAKALPNKKYTDCVQYYYLSKKKEGYKQLVRKHTLAKRKSKVLQQRPQLALGLEEQGRDIRESILPMETEDDSKKSSTSGPSLQRWSEEEIQAMKEGLREYGKDWLTISIKVGTKTEHQCRSFFRHYKRKVHLVGFLNEFKAREKAGVEASKQSVGISRIDEEDEEDEDLQKAARMYSSAQQSHAITSGVLAKDVQHQVGSTVTDITSRFSLVPTPEHDQFISIAASMVDDYGKSHVPEGSLEPPMNAFPVVSSSMQTSDSAAIPGALLPSELPNLSAPSVSTTNVAIARQPLLTATSGRSGLDLIAAAAEAVAARMAQTPPTTVSLPTMNTAVASHKQVRLEDLPRCLPDPRLENVSQTSRPSVAPLHAAVTVRTSTALLQFTPSSGATSQTKSSASPSNVLTLLIPLQSVAQAQAGNQVRPVQLSTTQSPGSTVATLVDATGLASPIQMPSPGALSLSTSAVACPRLTLRGNSQTVVKLAVRQITPYSQSIATQLSASQASRLTTVSSLSTTATLTVLTAQPTLVSSAISPAIVTTTRSTPTVCGVGSIVVGASGIPLDHSDLVKLERPSSITAQAAVEKPGVVKLSTSDTMADQPSLNLMDTSTVQVKSEAVSSVDTHQEDSVSQVSSATLCLPREPLLSSVGKGETVKTMDTSDTNDNMNRINFPDIPSSFTGSLMEVSQEQSSLQETADRKDLGKELPDDIDSTKVTVAMETDVDIADNKDADDKNNDNRGTDDTDIEKMVVDENDNDVDGTRNAVDDKDGNERNDEHEITEEVIEEKDGHTRDVDSEIAEEVVNDEDGCKKEADSEVTEQIVDNLDDDNEIIEDVDKRGADSVTSEIAIDDKDVDSEINDNPDSHKEVASSEVTAVDVDHEDGHRKGDDSEVTKEVISDEDYYEKSADSEITKEVIDHEDGHKRDADSEITEKVGDDVDCHKKDADSEITEQTVDNLDEDNEITEEIVHEKDAYKKDADDEIMEKAIESVDYDSDFNSIRSVESGEIIESDDDHISETQPTGNECFQQRQEEQVTYGRDTPERLDREVNLDKQDYREESSPTHEISEEGTGDKLKSSDKSNTSESQVNINSEVRTAKVTVEELELPYETVTRPDKEEMLPESCSIDNSLVGVHADGQRKEEMKGSEADVSCTESHPSLKDEDELDELGTRTEEIIQDGSVECGSSDDYEKNEAVQMVSGDGNGGLSYSGLQHIQEIDGSQILQSHEVNFTESLSPISDRDDGIRSYELEIGAIDEFSQEYRTNNVEVDFSVKYESISPALSPQSAIAVSQESSISAHVTQLQDLQAISTSDALELPVTLSHSPSCSSISPSVGRSSSQSSPVVKSPTACGLHESRSGAFLPASLPAMPSFGSHAVFSPRHSPHRSVEHLSGQASGARNPYVQVIEDISSDDEY